MHVSVLDNPSDVLSSYNNEYVRCIYTYYQLLLMSGSII